MHNGLILILLHKFYLLVYKPLIHKDAKVVMPTKPSNILINIILLTKHAQSIRPPDGHKDFNAIVLLNVKIANHKETAGLKPMLKSMVSVNMVKLVESKL